SLCRLNLVFMLWISMTLVCLGYPVGPSMSSSPFYSLRQLSGGWDSCLVLLSSCLSKVGRDEPTLGKVSSSLGEPLRKRSFRNGVGAGIKKTSYRRAK
ncbi:NPS protein, partial [Origma solitaria]|nr:NPS protein [Origma solitaria]